MNEISLYKFICLKIVRLTNKARAKVPLSYATTDLLLNNNKVNLFIEIEAIEQLITVYRSGCISCPSAFTSHIHSLEVTKTDICFNKTSNINIV